MPNESQSPRPFPSKRSIIPACDTDLTMFRRLIRDTADLPEVSGFKLGFELALRVGLPTLVEQIREHSDKPIIYDHQKGGTDIPDQGPRYAKVMAESKIDWAILFPLTGPKSLEAWVKAHQEAGVGIIVGAWMTHPHYRVSDGGFLGDEAILRIYTLSAELGVTHFVVPGNNLAAIRAVRSHVESVIDSPVYLSPGLVTQGGDISHAAAAAGERWHAIVGRGLYQAEDVRVAAQDFIRQLNTA